MKVALAQSNTRVGAIDSNTESLIATAIRARDELGAELVLFPELTLSGYPPEDLLLHGGLRRRIGDAIERVRREVTGITVCFGAPEYDGNRIYNSAFVVRDGEVVAVHRKWKLPNYAVFDEMRYFTSGDTPTVFEMGGVSFGLIVCEDAWFPEPAAAAAAANDDDDKGQDQNAFTHARFNREYRRCHDPGKPGQQCTEREYQAV